ncbi:MAG TPA: enolase C-terminal domain-like protein, partial [Tepidisphaeraceae bacterium]|nr:enolase C-terminal domain-like protein [Tepidisphaeraceae bacterium]
RGTLPVRHTVGLADDIGLIPTALERTGISRLKIKLGGDPAADVARIIEIMRSATGRIERITLDGNENYATIAALEDFLDRLAATPEAAPAAAALAWIEQPLHRSVSLSPELRSMFDRRPKLTMLLDESDASPADLPHALDLGYAGTTHKNCKGVFKTILAAMLLKQRSRAGRRLLLSGEDLTIVAPWAQAQDLAVAAAVGVVDIERNGQAFADGLQAFSLVDQGGALDRYGSLYRATSSGVELAIEAGSVDVTGSNLCAFGCWGC